MSEVRFKKSKPNLKKNGDNLQADDDKRKNLNIPQKPPLSSRIFAQVAVITSVLIIVYVTSLNRDGKVITFAKQYEVLSGKARLLECSSEYMKEVNKYQGCFPKQCARYVTDQVISEYEANALLKIAEKGLQLGGSLGGASILDLHSGALSKEDVFVNIYKIGEARNLFTEEDFNLYRVVKDKIKYSIALYFNVEPEKIFLTSPTFFSRLTSVKAASIHDEYWHPHVDKETYKSFHYTTLLYLNDYNINFKGGRFIFIDEKVNRTVEPRKGRLSMFTSGAENTHYVEKVTEGVRYAITISFTCDKKYNIGDPNVDKYITK